MEVRAPERASISVLLHWMVWNGHCLPENENGELVCNHQWTRNDSVGVHHLSHSSLAARSWVAMRFFPQTVYCCGSQCFLSVSALTGMLCPPRWACLRSCLPPCLPSGLGCCVRLAGLVFLLSAGLSPVLSAILAGMLCPPRWAVSGLVSQLVSYLVWDALSASLVLSFSCLWSCLPAFVFVLSRSLSFIWDAVSAPPGLVFFLSLVLSPSLSPTWSGMLCSPSWLVSQPSLSPVFCPILFSSWSGVSVLWACLQNFMCDLCNCLGSTVV